MERIPVAGPSITQREIDYVTDAVTNAWYGNANMYHERFEKSFAEYIGVRHAIALPSCTSAIHLSLLALGVGPGDEVIVPDATWIASAAPITYVGATPVFADIDQHSWCLSAASFERCITPKTKAVIAVDLYGNMPDIDAIANVARKHGIAIIEDAAEAIGSEYKGRKCGSFGVTGTFSFHGSKTLTTGEGGMLVTDDHQVFKRAQFLRDHGRQPGDNMFFNHEVAFKYKMSSLQAALGLAQLERIEELLEHKRRTFQWYKEDLKDVAGVTLNFAAPGTQPVFWMVTAILDPRFALSKEQLMERLSERGVDCRPFFHPLSSIPAYRQTEQGRLARARNEVSYRVAPHGLNLPSALNLTKETVGIVCTALKDILQETTSRRAS